MNGIFALFSITLLLALPGMVHGQTTAIKITPAVTVSPSGKTGVSYEITNNGAAAARHVTVTSFLADDARRSDNLGDAPPGGVIRHTCDFDTAELKPGTYTLVTRVSYGDAGSGSRGDLQHRVHHFTPLSFRADRAGSDRPALAVNIDPPVFNLRGLFSREGRFGLTLENGHPGAIRAVASFFLPDGVEMAATDKAYELKAGEKVSDELTLRREEGFSESRPYHAEVRYDAGGVHHSRLLEGTIRCEDRPLYFSVYLTAGGIVIFIVIVVLFVRSRRQEGRSPS